MFFCAGSPYTKVFSRELARMVEAGTVERLMQKSFLVV